MDEILLCCRDGIYPVILNLTPVVLVTALPLQVILTLLVVKDTTTDLLLNISLTELRQDSWNHQGNRGGSAPYTVRGGLWIH